MSGSISAPGAGVIVTLSDGTSRHVPAATVNAALRQVAAVCDARGLTVRSISTPGTILRDITKDRRQFHSGRGDTIAFVKSVEHELLGKIGRRALAPR